MGFGSVRQNGLKCEMGHHATHDRRIAGADGVTAKSKGDGCNSTCGRHHDGRSGNFKLLLPQKQGSQAARWGKTPTVPSVDMNI